MQLKVSGDLFSLFQQFRFYVLGQSSQIVTRNSKSVSHTFGFISLWCSLTFSQLICFVLCTRCGSVKPKPGLVVIISALSL